LAPSQIVTAGGPASTLGAGVINAETVSDELGQVVFDVAVNEITIGPT
jgi:hypothetical protein